MTTHIPLLARVATGFVALAALGAACGPQAQSEFAGDGWYQGRVLVCKTPGHCQQLRYPTAPGTYKATLKPARLYGVPAGNVRVTITANGRIAFDLAYGRQNS